MKSSICFLPVILLCVLLSGCANHKRSSGISYEISQANSGRRQVKDASAIQVLNKSDITRPYVVIGMVEAENGSLEQCLPLLRKEALKLGGDAITDVSPTSKGIQLGLGLFGNYAIWTANVIQWGD